MVSQARFGLFLHYGLYSLLGRHEWVQLREKIRVPEYAKLKDRFTADKFDADFITDLALEAEMKYVNLVTRHHDSFSLWATEAERLQLGRTAPCPAAIWSASWPSSARRRGWGSSATTRTAATGSIPMLRTTTAGAASRGPSTTRPSPSYATGAEHDLQKYLDFMTGPDHRAADRLRSDRRHLAGRDRRAAEAPKPGTGATTADFKCQPLYDYIREQQPQVLVSYKQGLLGTEDFFAPEHKAIQNEQGKPMEICTTLQKKGWGYVKGSPHLTADDVMDRLAVAASRPGQPAVEHRPARRRLDPSRAT